MNHQPVRRPHWSAGTIRMDPSDQRPSHLQPWTAPSEEPGSNVPADVKLLVSGWRTEEVSEWRTTPLDFDPDEFRSRHYPNQMNEVVSWTLCTWVTGVEREVKSVNQHEESVSEGHTSRHLLGLTKKNWILVNPMRAVHLLHTLKQFSNFLFTSCLLPGYVAQWISVSPAGPAHSPPHSIEAVGRVPSWTHVCFIMVSDGESDFRGDHWEKLGMRAECSHHVQFWLCIQGLQSQALKNLNRKWSWPIMVHSH